MNTPNDITQAVERVEGFAKLLKLPTHAKTAPGLAEDLHTLLSHKTRLESENERLREIAGWLASLETEDGGRSFPTKEMCAAARQALGASQAGASE